MFVARPGKLVVSPSVRYWQLLELVELYELYCLTGTGLVVLLLSPSLTQNKEELTDCCSLYFKPSQLLGCCWPQLSDISCDNYQHFNEVIDPFKKSDI